MGIDILVEFPFNARSAATPSRDFVRRFLCNHLRARFIAAGPDLSFGDHGSGNFELLEEMAPEYGFEAEVLHTYRGIPSDNTPVPLTWIAVDLKPVSVEQDEKGRMNVRIVESLFIDAIFRHITEDMVTHTHFFIFVRSHFDIYNKELEEKKARGWKGSLLFGSKGGRESL